MFRLHSAAPQALGKGAGPRTMAPSESKAITEMSRQAGRGTPRPRAQDCPHTQRAWERGTLVPPGRPTGRLPRSLGEMPRVRENLRLSWQVSASHRGSQQPLLYLRKIRSCWRGEAGHGWVKSASSRPQALD